VELCYPGGWPPVDPQLRGDAPLTPPIPGEPAQTAGPRDLPAAGLRTGLRASQAAGLGTGPRDFATAGPGMPRLVPVPIAHIAPDPLE
jgi:hypothetical protein